MENEKVLEEEIYEEENTRENKKARKEARRQAKAADFKRRVRKAQSRSKRIGWWYLFFNLLLAAAAFLPLYQDGTGVMSVTTFWKAFLNVKYISKNILPVVMGIVGATLYALVLLSVVLNFLKSLACLKKLHKKLPSRQNGYNRNAQAMQRLGKLYSGSLIAIVFFGYLMRVFADVRFTTLFWAVLALGVIVHFCLGLRSGNVSFFPVGQRVEVKRVGGRFAPFIRNLFQLIVVSLMMAYFLDINVISNLMKLFEKGALNTILKETSLLLVYVVLPAVQILMLVWILSLFSHAVRPNEFHHDGKKAPGRMTFRVISLFLFLTSAGAFAVTYLIANDKAMKGFGMSFGALYIAALALAAFIEEIAMRKLPNDRDNFVVNYETPVEPEQPAPVQFYPCSAPKKGASYHVPLACVTEPGVFMQPNGQPILLMPMIAGPRQMPAMGAPVNPEQPAPVYDYSYTNPYNNFATPYGNGNRTYDPYHQVAEPEMRVAEKVEMPAKAEEPVKAEDPANEGVALSREQLHQEALREMNMRQLTEKWTNMAYNPPRLEGDTAETANNAFVQPEEAANPASEPKTSGKNYTVTCPDCGTKVLVQEGSFAYRCPDCNCVFQLRKKN